MDKFFSEVMSRGDLIPVIAIAGGLIIAAIAIIFGSVKSMVVGTAKEKTKQELAAYVAAGTLDPDKAVAMINAGKDEGSCA
jgi:hypothetical protein